MTENTTPDAHRRLHEAVASLCSEGALTVRLEAAHGALSGIDPARDLPELLRFRFEELLADIAYGADDVHAAVARMSAPDREYLARRVLSMFEEAMRMLAPDA
jgi:hypothetical protein